MIAISEKSVKTHEKLAQSLRERIQAGVWKTGQPIPGRRGLAKEYGVALATVERAVTTLISEGLLSAEDRRGTFVAEKTAESGEVFNRINDIPHLSAMIGLIAPIIPYESPRIQKSQWAAQVLYGCEKVLAEEADVSQCFVNLTPEIGGEDIPIADGITQLLDQKVGAMLIIGAGLDLDLVHRLEKADIPVVCANYEQSPLPMNQVFVDDKAGGVQAVRHLRSRGYKKLIFLYPFSCSWVDERLAGARLITNEQEMMVYKPDSELIFEMEAPRYDEFGRHMGESFLKNGLEPGTGIIAPNDAIAAGFILYLEEQGLCVGKDYGILGFDDFNRNLQLTSLRPSTEQLGEEAARMILAMMRGQTCPTHAALAPQLIARMSTNHTEKNSYEGSRVI